MSLSFAFLILGLAQAIIFIVMRLFVQRATVGQPGPLLRAIVGIIGFVAVAMLVAAAYVAFVIESG